MVWEWNVPLQAYVLNAQSPAWGLGFLKALEPLGGMSWLVEVGCWGWGFWRLYQPWCYPALSLGLLQYEGSLIHAPTNKSSTLPFSAWWMKVPMKPWAHANLLSCVSVMYIFNMMRKALRGRNIHLVLQRHPVSLLHVEVFRLHVDHIASPFFSLICLPGVPDRYKLPLISGTFSILFSYCPLWNSLKSLFCLVRFYLWHWPHWLSEQCKKTPYDCAIELICDIYFVY